MSQDMSQLMIMLPAMFLMNKIDFEDEDNVFMLRCGFCAVQAGAMMCRLYIWMKVKNSNDQTQIKVTLPGKPEGFGTPPPGETKMMTINEYDRGEFKKILNQAFITLAIIGFLHLKFLYVRPLFLQLFMCPKQMWGNNLFQLHVMGADVARPFKEPASPFAALMGGGGSATEEEEAEVEVTEASATTASTSPKANNKKSKRSKKAD